MTKFTFVFSSGAMVSAVINFSFIYVIVMIFNIITLNRFKLIDLLYANRKNEKVKIKNGWLIFTIFIVSIGSNRTEFFKESEGQIYRKAAAL